MNEQDAWNTFIKTGSVIDYLEYKAVKNNTETYKALQGTTDENKDRGTYHKATEYR